MFAASGAFTGLLTVYFISRYIQPPARDISGNTKIGWVEVGPVRAFDDEPQKVFYGDEAVFVYKLKGQLVALSATCPHVRCVISWFPYEQVYHCPCHASAFAKDGRRLYGPAPRGLYPQSMRVAGGKLWLGGGTPPA